MDFVEKDPLSSGTKQIAKLFSRKYSDSTVSAGSPDVGFVFSGKGTEQAVKDITVGKGEIDIYNDYADKLLFSSEEKEQKWLAANNKRSLISKAVDALIRQTDIQYRVHGDRLHYFVLGRIIMKIKDNYGGTARQVFPLFLFSCQGDAKTIRRTLTMEIEQNGFINFPIDEKYLDSEICKCMGGVEISLDSNIFTKMTELQKTLPKKNFLNVESIEIDPSFSMIGVVTGFETEYLDKVWENI
jgi:hypothetical protein